MTAYQVDADAVLHATHTARTTIDRLHHDVSSLTHTLNTLSSVWTGQAAAAFAEVYSSWQATHHHVESQLSELANALAQAGQHYQDMEAANVALFRRS